MSFIPNTTPTPNWLYNGEMKKMNETELKVVLLITRKTLGWFDPLTAGRKEQDYISQSQFMDFTGQSNRAIATAIQSCVEYGWIIARDKEGNFCNTAEKRARRKVWYQLGSIFTRKISDQQSGEESSQDINLVKKVHQSGEESSPNLVNNVHSTKETLTKETIQKENRENYFLLFWKAYKKKVGKKEARKAWEKIKPELFDIILVAVENHNKQDSWKKDDGKFIPHPSTWLNQERWEDEIKTKPKRTTY